MQSSGSFAAGPLSMTFFASSLLDDQQSRVRTLPNLAGNTVPSAGRGILDAGFVTELMGALRCTFSASVPPRQTRIALWWTALHDRVVP